MKFFSAVLKSLGIKAAGAGSQACYCFLIDEPEMPKSLIK